MDTKKSPHVTEIEVFAPVRIPSQDKLTIELVPADLVYRLEEYRADERHWESVLWAFAGASLSIVINWFATDPISISRNSLVFLGILVVVVFLTFFARRNYKRRADEIKKRMFAMTSEVPAMIAARSFGEETSVAAFAKDSKLAVTIVSQNGKTVNARLPDVEIGLLLPALVAKLQLEPTGPNEFEYSLWNMSTGTALPLSVTLSKAGVTEGNRLMLRSVPYIYPPTERANASDAPDPDGESE